MDSEREATLAPPPAKTWARIADILKHGNTVELKKIGGSVHIIEIRRTIKDRVPPATGQVEG